MKINELLKYTSNILSNSDSARLDVEIILGYILNVDRAYLFLNGGQELGSTKQKLFLSLIKKRANGMPVAYITNTKDFWKSTIKVNQYTLVPRPDSETIIETFCHLYRNKNAALKIADLGTGTGCLLIAVAGEYRNIRGYGFEKMQQASFIAKQNVALNSLGNRIKIFNQSWNKITTSHEFDAIISNPPYIKRGEIKFLAKEVAIYEPKAALDGGVTGVEPYSEIFLCAKKSLKKRGLLFLEIGNLQHKDIRLMGLKNGFLYHGAFKDLSGIKRVLVFKR